MRFSPTASAPFMFAVKCELSRASLTRICKFSAILKGPILSVAFALYASTDDPCTGLTSSTPGRSAVSRGVSRRSFQSSSGEALTSSCSLILSSIAAESHGYALFPVHREAHHYYRALHFRQNLNCGKTESRHGTSCHNDALYRDQ